MNILIIGSNFGFKVHKKALESLKFKKKIFVCSPNIKKKNIKNAKLFISYEKAIKNNNFELIISATRPDIQKKFISYLLKIKKFPKFLLLEKPLSNKIPITIKNLKEIKNSETKIFSNFIFTRINNFKKLKKLLNGKKIKRIHYKWNFQQAYFRNKKKTWKTDSKYGGGLIYYYLIHVIYNIKFIYNFSENFLILKIEKLNKLLYSITFTNKTKNTQIFIEVNCNSKKNLHQIKVQLKEGTEYQLINKSKDWTKNFYLLKNNKNISKKSSETRIKLTKLNFLDVIFNNRYRNEKLKIIKANLIVDKLQKSIR